MTRPTLHPSFVLMALALLSGALLLWVGQAAESTGDGAWGVEVEADPAGSGATAQTAQVTPGRALKVPGVAPSRTDAGEPKPLAVPLLGSDQGVELRGLVLDATHGSGLGSVAIHLATDDWEMETETELGGEFLCRVPELNNLLVQATRPGFAPSRRVLGPKAESLVIKLQPEGRILGQVIGPAKKYAKGAQAVLWDLRIPQDQREPTAEVRIDNDGRFEFAELTGGEYMVCASIPGFPLVHSPWTTVVAGQSTGIALKPRIGGSLKGRVLEFETRKPLAGATVTSRSLESGVGWLKEAMETSVLTDKDGYYLLSGLPVDSSRVEVVSVEGAKASARVFFGEIREQLEKDFELGAPASLRGSVLTEGGNAVAFARVHLAWEGPVVSDDPSLPLVEQRGVLLCTADGQGKFLFENLPAGRRLTLLAFRASETISAALLSDQRSFPMRMRLKRGEERQNVNLRLMELQTIRGVVRSETGGGLEGAQIRVVTAKGRGKSRTDPGVTYCTVTSGPDGGFVIRGLLYGRYTLNVSRAGQVPKNQPFTVIKPPGSPRLVEVSLRDAATIEGRVVDEYLGGVPFAAVQAVRKGGRKSQKNYTRTDEYGRFLFAELTPGQYLVKANAKGFEPSKSQESVVIPGAPLLEFQLRLAPVKKRSVVFGSVRGSRGELLEGLKATGLGGATISYRGDLFELDGVPPGRLKVKFSAPGFIARSFDQVQIESGTTTDLGVLELPPAAELFVFVRGRNGKPIKNFTARLVPLDAVAKASLKRSFSLRTIRSSHRYRNAKKRIKGWAAHSDQVPFGRWRILVQRKGKGAVGLLAEQVVEFRDGAALKRVELEERTPRRKAPRARK